MALCARGSYGFLASRVDGSLATVCAIALAALVYLLMVLLVGAITKEDISHLPMGNKLTKFVPFP
jgi:stage V sporulation protein B